MSIVKHFNKDLYPCIQDTVLEILDKHLVSGFGSQENRIPIYSHKAIDDICAFLAVNDIQHQYTILPTPAGAECAKVISLVWHEPGMVGHEVWYAQAPTQKIFNTQLTIAAENEDEIIDWIANIEEMKILDWSVTEI